MTPEEIKAMRKRLGLSQEDFAALIDVSTQTVCSWEIGKHKPINVHLKKLMARHFNKKSSERLDEKV